MTLDSGAGAEAGGADVAGSTEELNLDTGNQDTGLEGGSGEGEEPSKPEGEGEQQPQKAMAPLPPEEVEKRWRQTTSALKETRGVVRQLRQQIAALQAPAGQQQPAGQSQQREAVKPPPDPNVDPQGAMQWIIDRVNANDAREAEQAETRQQQAQREQAVQSVIQGVAEYERDFREDHPDYDDAVKHLRQSRQEELELMGVPPDRAALMVNQEVFQTAANLLRQGIDPSRFAYQTAIKRGYKSGQGQSDGKPNPGNPASDALDKITQGQEAAKTIGSGARPSGELTIESVSKLNGAAFDAAFKKLMAQESERERRLG